VKSYPHNLPARFREVVGQFPDRKALIWSETSAVTFAELDRLSDRVALFLQKQGVTRGDPICIRLDKCTLSYSLIIACLKLGAPYFVVDPANPAERAAHIISKCKPRVVFSAKESPMEIAGPAVFVIDREDEFRILQDEPNGPIQPCYDITGADPAYIMFTSGSTGFPKGAVMSHANVMNFIAWSRAQFAVTPDDVFTNVNPLYFDNSVFDLYASLFNGAALVPFDTATIKDPYRVLQRIDEQRCTIYFSVPSLLIYFQTLKLITPRVFTSIRTIIFGGEGYPKPRLKELFDCFHPRLALVNVYGPTECTCICSAYDITSDDFRDLDGYPPLGSLIPNFSHAILNERDQSVARGESGELYLSGPCVGLGYFNDPELTRKAFTQNPLNSSYDERVYRTGDLVRLSAEDGKIYFAGRKDSQIKHQGYRIELGEIEHALGRVPGVDEAVALHSNRGGISLIVAVVASRSGLAAEVIRKEAARFLPAYMVPGRVDVTDQLPKNANGKIDRNLLKTRYC
jgi:D-alanine--poly(phosphoribitol) ligase subunit 1